MIDYIYSRKRTSKQHPVPTLPANVSAHAAPASPCVTLSTASASLPLLNVTPVESSQPFSFMATSQNTKQSIYSFPSLMSKKKKKSIPKSNSSQAIGHFVSSLFSAAHHRLAAPAASMLSVSTSSTHDFQHATFAFETPRSQPTSTIDFLPRLPRLPTSRSDLSSRSDVMPMNAPVGQFLLGTGIGSEYTQDLADWHSVSTSSVILSPMQSSMDIHDTMDVELAESLLTSTARHLVALLRECDWMLSQMDASEEGWFEWGYMSLQRHLQQAKHLLHPFDHAACLRDQLFALERQQWDHTTHSLSLQVRLCKRLLYQGMVAIHTGLASVVTNQDYWIEPDDRAHAYDAETLSDAPKRLQIDHKDETVSLYQDVFVGKPYVTLMGNDGPHAVILTICWEEEHAAYCCILRHAAYSPDRREWLHTSASPFTKEWRTALTTMYDTIDLDNLTEIHHRCMQGEIEHDLALLDQDWILRQFKVGVLYVPHGQYYEEDWFSNKDHPSSFADFLTILGHEVKLQDYQGWAAGLDTKSNASGEYTYRTTLEHDQYEIVYHVATLMPLVGGDKQYIQRKRYIGNDIVCIVYMENDQAFDPAAIKSQFLHAFVVVHHGHLDGRPFWRVTVTCIKQVPGFGPQRTSQVFFDIVKLQQYILAKVINAEYAALKAPKLSKVLDRARQGILADAVERGLKMQANGSFRHLSPDPNQMINALKMKRKKKHHMHPVSVCSSPSSSTSSYTHVTPSIYPAASVSWPSSTSVVGHLQKVDH